MKMFLSAIVLKSDFILDIWLTRVKRKYPVSISNPFFSFLSITASERVIGE